VNGSNPLQDATYLWVIHHDFSGIGRVRVIPRHRFEEVIRVGVKFGYNAWDYTFYGTSIPSPRWTLASGDFNVIPDKDTMTPLPHAFGATQVFSFLYDEKGIEWDGDPRGRLRNMCDRLIGLGYRIQVGFESEFHVVSKTADTEWSPCEQFPMWSVGAVEDQWNQWIQKTLQALITAEIPVYQFTREGSKSQFECSLMPLDPVSACDKYLIARQIIKGSMPSEIIATFMPKIYQDRAGSGLHAHISITNLRGDNILADPNNAIKLSSLGEQIVSKLVRHAPAEIALAAPSTNSFRRLVTGQASPTYASWSFGNRSALIRIPGFGDSRRIEYRSGDQSCNPYLYILGILASICDAIGGSDSLVKPVDKDLSLMNQAEISATYAEPLPRSVPEALELLGANTVLTSALGPEISNQYLAVKREEHEIYLRETGGGTETVTDWERETFLKVL
jgi:glutamine synthetase